MPTTESSFSFQTREEKKTYVRKMFGEIAGRYDFFNHFLSAGFDFYWRKTAIQLWRDRLQEKHHPKILDIACGTGDLAFEAIKQIPAAEITGSDITLPMLDLFRKKIQKRGLRMNVEEGDVEDLQYPDNSFDAVTIGFATRNFTNLDIAFKEIHRVLKPGGVFINLELARPRVFPMKQLYKLYFDNILPGMASMMSKHNSAYRYLPDSLRRFPDLEPLAEIMTNAGFKTATWKTLTAGIVSVHIGVK
jgi:demethylmenaquinone methyltransferase / 2-methoxy-6-polyprenyl-1,4-benzoquinol methylase